MDCPPIHEGLHVFVELLLSRRREPGKKARVKVEGDVLRSIPEGMVIRFREGYSITAVALWGFSPKALWHFGISSFLILLLFF